MRGYHFPPTSNTADWSAPFYIALEGTNYLPDPGTHQVPQAQPIQPAPPAPPIPPVPNLTRPNYPPMQKAVTATRLVTWHPPDDEVLVGLSPDVLMWEDYGSHRSSYPPNYRSPPFFRASSNDASGYVMLRNPGLVDILIPAAIMRGFGPGELNVGLRYARASDQRTATIFVGRLPVVHGVV